MNSELLQILTAWAVLLSPYPAPDQLPAVELVSHQWLINQACRGQECSVVGWYTDEGVIYLDEDKTEREDILVHEIVHYLQDLSGRFTLSCKDRVVREIEAYSVQNEYLVRNGYRRHETLKVMACRE